MTRKPKSADHEIAEIVAEHQAAWAEKRRWVVVQEPNGFTVHEHMADSVSPTSRYSTVELAAARLLQLLGIKKSIAPQDHPETVCIGKVSVTEDIYNG